MPRQAAPSCSLPAVAAATIQMDQTSSGNAPEAGSCLFLRPDCECHSLVVNKGLTGRSLLAACLCICRLESSRHDNALTACSAGCRELRLTGCDHVIRDDLVFGRTGKATIGKCNGARCTAPSAGHNPAICHPGRVSFCTSLPMPCSSRPHPGLKASFHVGARGRRPRCSSSRQSTMSWWQRTGACRNSMMPCKRRILRSQSTYVARFWPRMRRLQRRRSRLSRCGTRKVAFHNARGAMQQD